MKVFVWQTPRCFSRRPRGRPPTQSEATRPGRDGLQGGWAVCPHEEPRRGFRAGQTQPCVPAETRPSPDFRPDPFFPSTIVRLTAASRPPDALSPPPRSQTVFELAKQLPEYGVGARFARTRWEHRGAPDSYWTVSRMKPKPSGRAGRAWGTLTWKGEAKEGVRRIPGSMKAGIWRVLEEPKTTSGPKLSKPEPSEEAAEGQ